MKKFVAIIEIQEGLNDAFVIEAESLDDPKVKEQLFNWILAIGDGCGRDSIANNVDEFLEGDTDYLFSRFEIYEVKSGLSKTANEELKKDFVEYFMGEEKRARKRQEDQAKRYREQDYLRLKAEFEKT